MQRMSLGGQIVLQGGPNDMTLSSAALAKEEPSNYHIAYGTKLGAHYV